MGCCWRSSNKPSGTHMTLLERGYSKDLLMLFFLFPVTPKTPCLVELNNNFQKYISLGCWFTEINWTEMFLPRLILFKSKFYKSGIQKKLFFCLCHEMLPLKSTKPPSSKKDKMSVFFWKLLLSSFYLISREHLKHDFKTLLSFVTLQDLRFPFL